MVGLYLFSYLRRDKLNIYVIQVVKHTYQKRGTSSVLDAAIRGEASCGLLSYYFPPNQFLIDLKKYGN